MNVQLKQAIYNNGNLGFIFQRSQNQSRASKRDREQTAVITGVQIQAQWAKSPIFQIHQINYIF
jgi:hypothetical protein